jgi:hypothetical protein
MGLGGWSENLGSKSPKPERCGIISEKRRRPREGRWELWGVGGCEVSERSASTQSPPPIIKLPRCSAPASGGSSVSWGNKRAWRSQEQSQAGRRLLQRLHQPPRVKAALHTPASPSWRAPTHPIPLTAGFCWFTLPQELGDCDTGQVFF